MRQLKYLLTIILLFILTCCAAAGGDEKKVYYAIEINGVVCGYTESSDSIVRQNGKEYIRQNMDMFIMLSLLGSEFNTEMKIVSHLDPVSKRCFALTGNIKQGDIKRNFDVKVKDGEAVINSTLMGTPRTIQLKPDILFGSDEVYHHVKKEFVENNADEINYDILEAIDAEIQNSTFKKIGKDTVELAGKKFATLIIEQRNNKTGTKIKYWLNPELDYFVMFQVQNRKIYLTDHTVVDKIKVASMDGLILTKTNAAISDVQAITYMKLKVEIQPTGINLKREDLNVPGQKFDGTIVDNLVKGIIEIQHERYSGENAPLFPPDYTGDEMLFHYIQASDNIQSDDPVLIRKAEEITRGAENSWEASIRLSKWVAENIHYAIPGGGSAKGAYEMRAGECGAHSMLLAAFCRAVGIPARVVYGGMYVPNKGGAFGQHAWNEIYMGQAGWIPVDATAFETDFVDAGHIRISEHLSASSSFNAKSIEILDYKLAGKAPAEGGVSPEKYALYLGKYTNPESGKTFEVLVKEGNLSVDIPGQMVLPFREEDEKGRWYCKLSNRLFLEFKKDEDDSINRMIFHELVVMQRQPEEIKMENVPENLRPYIGAYYFAAINSVFEVRHFENSLAVYDRGKDKTVKLHPPDENGGWLDEYNKNTIYFEKNAEGKVVAMHLDASTRFIRE